MTVYVRSEDVANELATRLSQISITNGYETDIGLRVQRGRRKLPADDEPPLVQLVEGSDDVIDESGRSTKSLIKVEQPYVFDA